MIISASGTGVENGKGKVTDEDGLHPENGGGEGRTLHELQKLRNLPGSM